MFTKLYVSVEFAEVKYVNFNWFKTTVSFYSDFFLLEAEGLEWL